MSKYWENITDMANKQREKGLRKYGQILEENTEMNAVERIEMIQQELINELMRLEHMKEYVKENKEFGLG